MEGRELEGGVLLAIEPAVRVELLGIRAPDTSVSAHGPRAPLEELAFFDLHSIYFVWSKIKRISM